MSKQDDELRELFVKYGYPRITEAELNLIPAISTYISTHYISKAGVLNLLRQYDTEVRGVTQSHLNPMHWTKRTKHRNELRDELIEALGLTSKEK